jgi:hypothetical protein
MSISIGTIIYVRANFANPPKSKYLLCVCPIASYYLVINTEPYLMAQSAQLRVTPAEIPCLNHDSFIDTSKLVKLSKMETETPVQSNPNKALKGVLCASVKARIVSIVALHGIMPQHQADLLTANFTEADGTDH